MFAPTHAKDQPLRSATASGIRLVADSKEGWRRRRIIPRAPDRYPITPSRLDTTTITKSSFRNASIPAETMRATGHQVQHGAELSHLRKRHLTQRHLNRG